MHDCLDKIKADLRVEFINALNDLDVEHKVSVNNKLANGGKIDYKEEAEMSIKSAKLTRKPDKNGGYYYILRAVVEG